MSTIESKTNKKYKYKKICKLARCSKTFETNREWQNFCCPEHKKEYWLTEQKSDANIRKELSDIKKEQIELKKQLAKYINS